MNLAKLELQKLIGIAAVIILFSALLVACKKETVEPEPTPQISNTFDFPDNQGTYWVYQFHIIDSLGNEVPDNIYDTITVVGDTTINGNNYTIHQRSQGPLLFQRDSSGYFIDPSGFVLFSYVSPGTEVLYSHDASVTLSSGQIMMNATDKMLGATQQLSTNAGIFESYVKRRAMTDLGGGPINVCGDYEFVVSEYYSSGIGMVRLESTMPNVMDQQCLKFYWELIDYNLE